MTDIRIGSGYDIHRTDRDRPLVLCGVTVPAPFGLSGHSDADVALHALADALLGAMGQRDIGYHFPDTDPRYEGIESSLLLQRVMDMLDQNGYRVGNADLTIIAQRPRLSPYIPLMIRNVSRLLRTEAVNVKATTHEQLGALGACEGIAAHAVALLCRTD